MPKRESNFEPSHRMLARLTMDKPGAFTAGERIAVVCWLRKQANDLERDGEDTYTADGRYTARVLRTAKGLEAR